MARKKKQPEKDKIKTTGEYYKLKTKAVEDLVTAAVENSPEVSQEELDKYRHRSKISLSHGVKMFLVKMWFAGAVCFFIFWGLGNYVADQLDMLVVFGVVLGMVTDLLTNNALRFFARTEGENDRWMMFPKKRYATFFLNILYAVFLLFCVSNFYQILNLLLLRITGATEGVPLGVEPILFGLFYTCFDMLFIGMKRLVQSIVSDAKRSVGR